MTSEMCISQDINTTLWPKSLVNIYINITHFLHNLVVFCVFLVSVNILLLNTHS